MSQILKNTNAKLLDKFNASLNFDKKLYKQDIRGSIAHSRMLAKQNIISNDDQKKIEIGLKQIEIEIEKGDFIWDIAHEDIHMAVENRLGEIIGEVSGKLHTARSRNDQVATDFTLYLKDSSNEVLSLIKELMKALVSISKEHTQTLIPGYTHLQHAQPTNFGYHLLAYVNMFKRDVERFEGSIKRNNYSPLGSAALAGTPHNIDRDFTANELGFDAPTMSALDTVSNRDFALEFLFNISTLMMHISRLSEELITWSSYEFQFVKISDDYATTSSIMPQKKNPDVPELLRAKTGRVYGNLISLLTVMKGLPLAYNKDTQEDKEGVFDSFETATLSLKILTDMMSKIEVKKENMLEACKIGHLSATDLADYLVQKDGMAFRRAYYITKDVVAIANKYRKDVSELTIEEIREVKELENIDEEILSYLNLENSMNTRDSYGGTSTAQTKVQIEFFEKYLR